MLPYGPFDFGRTPCSVWTGHAVHFHRTAQWQQPLVGAAKGIPAAASWLEADLKGEPSMVRAWLGHGRPHPRPVWSVQLGMAAGEGGAGWLGCAGGGARRAK